MSNWVVRRPHQGFFNFVRDLPGDKSISHRALILSAIATGPHYITGFLFGADNLATAIALQQLGVSIVLNVEEKSVTVEGVGLHGLQPSDQPLDMGNSGTAMRLFIGLLAGQHFTSTLIGDASLSRRPMLRVVEPLRMMGAVIDTTDSGTAPVTIYGGHRLHAIDYTLPVASAQVYSALQLAGLYAEGEMHIEAPSGIRDHTERMLRTVEKDRHIIIPADLSSAAFLIVAATLVPNSRIILHRVGVNATRTGIIDILRLMGANITMMGYWLYGDEWVTNIRVCSAVLQGINIPPEYVPRAIDEIPILLIAAAAAKGITRLTGASELRVKESDRLFAMQEGLMRLGIHCESLSDGLVVRGGEMTGGCVESYGDHRIAMSFAVAGCIASGPVEIKNCDHVETSFPDFVELTRKLGFSLDLE